MGKPELREEITRYYKRLYGVNVDPEQVIVTSGSSPAMLLAFSVLLHSGDEVILPDPYYACYPNFIHYLAARPVLCPLAESDGFAIRAEQVRKLITSRTKAILINSPGNPTGAVISKQELQALAGLGPFIISDEVYHGINFTGRDHTALEFTDRAIVINSFSKRHVMTGWRLGYVIAPPALVRPMQKLQQNLFISACSFIQAAGISALRDDEQAVAERFRPYNERRLYLYRALQRIGIAPAVPPAGAFYILARVKSYTADSYRLALDILEKAGVAVTPGIDFGPSAEGYLRLSYACPMAELQEAVARLEKYFSEF